MSDEVDKKTEQSLYERLGGKSDQQHSVHIDEEDEEGGSADEEIELTPQGDEKTVELEQQLAEKHDQLLRAHAEMQNLRRRMDKEVVKARKFALERFINELLPIVDSLEKASHYAYTHPDAKEIHDGIELTLKMFIDCLQSSGVEVVDPIDDVFNPEFHEAMSAIEKPNAEKNSIIEVLQKGYVLNGRLVRPARVIVAK